MSDAVISKREQQQGDLQKSPLECFLAINEARIERVHSSLSARKRAFLDVLPMLFHANDSDLPGYISENTPYGIRDYTPGKESIYEARRLAKSRKIGKKAHKKFDLLGLYFMGSAGTVTYNGHSDFDIWVFVANDIEDSQVTELEQKVCLLEEWAAKSQIEAHFHVITPDKFRSGENRPLSQESSGSAQHDLLLDEFYRSSILIAGQSLTWWSVPPEQEAHTDDYLLNQKHFGCPDTKDIESTINLGGLAKISPQEYFGAAIWQLNKSISSPYKSVLKLLLMEVYAHDKNGHNLISHRFKKSVYEGITDISALDPWLLMFEQVEEYLQDQQDEVRLHILRRSFYLKVNEKLSHEISDELCMDNWQRKLLRQRVKAWGWDEEQIIDLDRRDSWKLETVLKERSALVSTLTKSFRFLSRDVRERSTEIQITQDDLTILGRRLYSTFERKTGKVEIINQGISPDICENTVSLHLLESPDMPSSWVLYRGIIKPSDLGYSTHLKKASSLIEILSWGYFNQILTDESQIMLYLPADNTVNQQELKTLQQALYRQFPVDIQKADDLALSQPVQMKSAALFVNTGLQPKSDPFLADTHLSSTRNNALSYGGQHENLTMTFDLVYTTSWGETFIQHYSSQDALMDCLTEYLSWSPQSTDLLKVFCYSPGYGSQIRNTLNNLFGDIVEHFYSDYRAAEGRYLLELEDGYKSIEIQGDVASHRSMPDNNSLMDYLSESLASFSPVCFNTHTCQRMVLPALYQRNKADTVQLFFYLKGNLANIYVLDEKGTLFYQQLNYTNKHSLFGHYKLFSDNVIERVSYNALSAVLDEEESNINTEMYLIKKDPIDSFLIQPLLLLTDRSSDFSSLQVLYQHDEHEFEQTTVYCEDQEFSSLQYGNALFHEVARHLVTRSNQHPVYITDIDLSQSMLSDGDDPALHSAKFFQYKSIFESKLTAALGNK